MFVSVFVCDIFTVLLNVVKISGDLYIYIDMFLRLGKLPACM